MVDAEERRVAWIERYVSKAIEDRPDLFNELVETKSLAIERNATANEVQLAIVRGCRARLGGNNRGCVNCLLDILAEREKAEADRAFMEKYGPGCEPLLERTAIDDAPPEESPEVVSPNDPRDAWIYEKVCAGVPQKELLPALKTKSRAENWAIISTWAGATDAAERYANRKNLPSIPKRRVRFPRKNTGKHRRDG